jgi:chaperonin cofactor prefoldin
MNMDLQKVLNQLHEELENLNAAIASLERLQEASRLRGEPLSGEVLKKPARRARDRKTEGEGETGNEG